ncbi:MAG: choice-of-anchor D domain-containing protein, partial [Cyclobacteriaceae bacterium]
SPAGSDIVRQLTITNEHQVDLLVSNISASGSAFSFSLTTPFTVGGELDGIYDKILFEITLSGATPGTFNETVTITSDDDADPVFEFQITGMINGGEIAVFEGASTAGVEIFDAQITALDFGTASQGNNLNQQFTIENQGTVALNISSINISGSAYSLLTAVPPSLGVGLNQTLDIQLSGATAGTFNETVTITSDDADEGIFTFPITGAITSAGCSSPPTASVGAISDICEGSTIALIGTIGGSAAASTWTTPGDGSFDNVSLLNAIYTPGSGDISNGSVGFTLTTDDPDATGPCVAATVSTTINIGRQATVNAGTDQTICTSDVASLTGSIGAFGTNPMWSTNGTGTFSSPNTINSDYTPSGADITAGSVMITLAADGTGACPQVTDQLILTIAQPIVAGTPSIQSNVSQAANVDIIASSTINTGDVITVTILLNPTKGSVVINPNNSIDYTATTGTIGSDSFQYRICNQCGLCSDGTVTIDIQNAAPQITPPLSPITSLAGQSVTIPFSTFITDLNGNIDFNSIRIT